MEVIKASIADAVELEQGDTLLSINGQLWRTFSIINSILRMII